MYFTLSCTFPYFLRPFSGPPKGGDVKEHVTRTSVDLGMDQWMGVTLIGKRWTMSWITWKQKLVIPNFKVAHPFS